MYEGFYQCKKVKSASAKVLIVRFGSIHKRQINENASDRSKAVVLVWFLILSFLFMVFYW